MGRHTFINAKTGRRVFKTTKTGRALQKEQKLLLDLQANGHSIDKECKMEMKNFTIHRVDADKMSAAKYIEAYRRGKFKSGILVLVKTASGAEHLKTIEKRKIDGNDILRWIKVPIKDV